MGNNHDVVVLVGRRGQRSVLIAAMLLACPRRLIVRSPMSKASQEHRRWNKSRTVIPERTIPDYDAPGQPWGARWARPHWFRCRQSALAFSRPLLQRRTDWPALDQSWGASCVHAMGLLRHTRPSSRSLNFWPMRRFECLPSGIRNHDTANFDSLIARLNGLTLDRCEPAGKQAA